MVTPLHFGAGHEFRASTGGHRRNGNHRKALCLRVLFERVAQGPSGSHCLSCFLLELLGTKEEFFLQGEGAVSWKNHLKIKNPRGCRTKRGKQIWTGLQLCQKQVLPWLTFNCEAILFCSSQGELGC